jgi:hypothetical protein
LKISMFHISCGATLAGMKKMGLLLLAAVLPVSPLAFPQTAQPQAASRSAPPTAGATSTPSAPVEAITLGNSIAALTGPWKFAPGDSPWVNGSPVWAQPGFDDSKWAEMDMMPKTGVRRSAIRHSGLRARLDAARLSEPQRLCLVSIAPEGQRSWPAALAQDAD